MLELRNITKIYPLGEGEVRALRGIDLSFRKSEFVSILGPSGCGKTTLLNIIGGLDKYTEGDLEINGTSTRNYRDRDWDTYRNHSVGFVFQSYNLIPHQSILQNVELSLTLAGISKSERRRRAREALERVGLSDQLRKKPGEMSGGQMQRVAIARAIVNDPDIVLADEPTGALDSETSVQVLDILKEISRDRLVVMVTHNPDLAEKYSTRIIRMLDGKITDDSRPVTEEETARDAEDRQVAIKLDREKKKRPSMSFLTSFSLSLKNLFTKKGRTALTAFAGSIGIIGIALIIAVSKGTTVFIDSVQEESLSSYPLTIESEHADLSSLIEMFIESAESSGEHGDDRVYQSAALYNLVNAMNNIEVSRNDLHSFRAFLEREKVENGEFGEALNGISYRYDTDLTVYTKNVDGNVIHSDLRELMRNILSKHMGTSSASGYSSYLGGGNSLMTSMMTRRTGIWTEMLSGDGGRLVSPLIEKQYELVYGTWPNDLDEIVLILDENNEISDMTLFALGLKSEEEMDSIITAAIDGGSVTLPEHSWSYEEIAAADFRIVLDSDCYTYDAETGTYSDLRTTQTGEKYLYDNALRLKVVGIIRPYPNAISSMLTGTVGYTKALTEYIITKAEGSEAVKAQKNDRETDIFTGLPFRPAEGDLSTSDKAAKFLEYAESLDAGKKAEKYIEMMSIPSDDLVDEYLSSTVEGLDRKTVEEMMLQAVTAQTGIGAEEAKAYISSMSDEDITEYFREFARQRYVEQYAEMTHSRMSEMPESVLVKGFDAFMEAAGEEYLAKYYDDIFEFSDSTYEENLSKLGVADLETPSGIDLYASTFAGKDVIVRTIDEYNDSVDEMSAISYTDYVGIMMKSVTIIIDAITYVLIGFVAVSLIVSSIMIGVITLISVQERTKEIGILRAIGASKRNVSSLFSAETVIIGLASGILGVAITYLLCIPIDIILQNLTKLSSLRTNLPVPIALILILISVLLNLISGIIPSRSAARKDPVVALRTE